MRTPNSAKADTGRCGHDPRKFEPFDGFSPASPFSTSVDVAIGSSQTWNSDTSNIVPLLGQNIAPREHQQFSGANSDSVVTEDAAASRFAQLYAGRLRYCHDSGAWFEWNGSTWKQDKTGHVLDLARDLARTLSARTSDRDRYTLNKTSFSAAIERFARTDRGFVVTSENWNRDPMLLGTPNGTVDLRTGILRTADPMDGITKATSITPVENAHCPIWKAFLLEACGGDHELIRFLQQWLGYGLSGLTKEHALVFIYGGGGEGKSTFLNTASRILGNYAVTSSMDTFTASRSDKHPTDLAMLRGARFVTASETEEGRPWAEARIKQLTGGRWVRSSLADQTFEPLGPLQEGPHR
jgi:putative DNA primase/helicase